MSFNLKEFREVHLKQTQAEFAAFIGERQDTISRWEQGDPDDIPVGKLKIIAKKTGQTLDQLIQYEKPVLEALKVEDTWKSAEFTKRMFIDYLTKNRKDSWEFYSRCPEIVAEYASILKTNIRKPRVAFVGQSDVGKSTMINALLGTEKMPTAWTPTTSITVYIIHLKDRPSFISEDAWVFKSDGEAKNFDIALLNDEEKCKKLCVAKGGAEILKQYGTRQGKHYDEYKDVVAAVLFVDSDILQNVTLIDLPGFGTGDREADDTATRGIGELTDVLVYLSRANGFLSSGAETACLRPAIQGLPCLEKKGKNNIPPLGNLFIVASQAHTVDGGNEYSLREILDTKCRQFERILPGTTAEFFAERNGVSGYESERYLRERFFTYSTDIPSLRQDFEDNLRTVIENIPEHTIETTKQLLNTYAKNNEQAIEDDIESFYRLLDDKEKEEEELSRIIANEPARKHGNVIKCNGIVKQIQAYCNASVASFQREYDRILSVDNIVDRIKARGFKKKKEDVEALSNYIGALLEDALKSTLTDNSAKLKDQINEYISDFEDGCNVDGKMGISTTIPFDAKRAFASGLAGAATFGGLALWASTLGNLGAYILVAKGVSLLSVLGISISGGTAAATAAVAAIGGPVVLGIALAVIAALSVFAIFSGGWEKKIAKKLIESYTEKDALRKYENIIKRFWLDDTLSAFKTSADAMENAWQESIENKQALIDNYDVEDIQRRIKIAAEMKNFLSGIPL